MTDNKEREALLLEAAEHLSTDGHFMSWSDAKRAAALIRKFARQPAALAASQEKAEPVAYVDGDDSLRRILWEPDQAAFNLPVGTKLYAAPVAAQEKAEPVAACLSDAVNGGVSVMRIAPSDAVAAPVAAQASEPVALYTMDEMRAYADEFHQARLNAAPQPSAEAVRDAALDEAANTATGFLVGDPLAGIPLRNPMTHEIADAIRALKSAPPQPAEQTDDEIDDLFDRSGWVPVDEPGGLHFTAHNLIKPAAPAPSASPAALTAGQMQSLERVEYFLKAWEWGGVGPSVAQVSDSPDSYVVLTISDLRTTLAIARAQGEQA